MVQRRRRGNIVQKVLGATVAPLARRKVRGESVYDAKAIVSKKKAGAAKKDAAAKKKVSKKKPGQSVGSVLVRGRKLRS